MMDIPKSERRALLLERVQGFGSLVRDGRMSASKARELALQDALVNELFGPGNSSEEEYVLEDEIDKALEPHALNGGGTPIKTTLMTTTALSRQSKKPYKLMFACEITAEGTLKVFLIDGFVGHDEVSFWFGEPECGKSTVLIDAACHVATGRPWCGRAVMQGAVLYVASERGQTVKRRILAWRIEHEIDEFPLAVIDDAVDLRTGTVDTDRILAAAAEVAKVSGQKVVLIIFDTLSRVLAGGDENSSKDMGLLVLSVDRIHRETGAHCSLVHHMPLNGDRMRGHGLANGAGDTTVKVEKKDGVVTASVAKASDLPEDEKPSLSFRFKSITVSEQPLRTASVMIHVEGQAAPAARATKTTRKESKVVLTFRDAVTEALDSSGEAIQVRGTGPNVRAVDVQKVRAEFERRYATGEPDPEKRADAIRKAFKRTITKLPAQFATETRDSRELIWKVD